MGNLILTKHPELRWLMSFEFHKDGQEDFYDKDVKLYLQKRLHPIQKNMLNYRAKPNWLTAIITFGDGNIDHTMGGTIRDQSVVRPNASLALFYKHPASQGDDIELVFYTRFFTISYGIIHPKGVYKKIIGQCTKLETEKNNSERKKIKDSILKYMLKLITVKDIPSLDEGYGKQRGAKECHLRIVQWWNETDLGNIYIPWLQPLYIEKIGDRQKLKVPYWLYQGNTIHGAINTFGCWMLLRNFLWLWPNEYRNRKEVPGDTSYYKTDYYYTGLNRCYKGASLGRSSSWLNACVKKVLKHPDSPLTPGYTENTRHKMFQHPARNFVYCEFVRLFAGLKYTHSSKEIIFPKDTPTYTVKEDSSAKNKFKTNITIPGNDYLKDEIVHFYNLPEIPAKIKQYKSDGGTITLHADLPTYPKRGDKFFISRKLNCWKSSTRNYGPNFFGHNCANNPNQFWADVYVFKRTDRFTEEENDDVQFQKGR